MKRDRKIDSLRGLAGVYVMFAHGVYDHSLTLALFGQEVAIMFFILSGFVISMSMVRDPECFCFRNFIIKRFRRVYPMFLIALFLGWAATSYGVGFAVPVVWRQLLGNIAMLQDVGLIKPGVWFDAYFNPPLWSLSYEWWFYVAFFPIWSLVPAKRQRHLVFALASAGTIFFGFVPAPPFLFASYFIIWWMGVEFAREYLSSGSISWLRQRSMIAIGWEWSPCYGLAM